MKAEMSMMGLVAIKERKVAEEAATGLGKKSYFQILHVLSHLGLMSQLYRRREGITANWPV